MTSAAVWPPVPAEDLEHVIRLTEPLWGSLRRQRLFMTGGTGFIGTWLLETIAFANDRLGTGTQVTVLTRDQDAFTRRSPHLAARPDLVLHRGDVRSFAFPAGDFGYIVHGATDSRATSQSADRAGLAATIVQGTARVLDMACGAGARSVLFLSSGAVYGPQPEAVDLLPETFPGGPDPLQIGSTYAEAKRMAEHLCCLAGAQSLGVRIARLFALVGPLLPLDAQFAVGNFILDAKMGRAIAVQGDGTPLRSYLHAADLMVWLLHIMVRGQSGRAYNVGSDRHVSIAGLAETVARIAGRPGAVVVAKRPEAGPRARYVPDISRARGELGLEVRLDLEESLRRTLRWVRAVN